MIDSLYIGATGMQAQQLNVDVIANNLANVNTAGFKKNRVTFEDSFYQVARSTLDAQNLQQNQVVLGMGTLVSSNSKSFAQGEIKATESPLDLAIQGNGFFEVVLPDGRSAYTRYGSLKVSADGYLSTSSGYQLKQDIQVSADILEVVIDKQGKVSGRSANENELVELGQIELTNFANPEGLDPIGENLYLATSAAGQISSDKAGENGFGSLSQGYLESSNVKLAEEMVNLVLAQRAYELNAKLIQASDEMLSISNNLRR